MIKNKQINIKNISNYIQTSKTDTPIINKQFKKNNKRIKTFKINTHKQHIHQKQWQETN
jgi:hypothetical protein